VPNDATVPSPDHARYLRDDDAFDALYPREIRRISRRFWTPLETARRAAALLRDAGARQVLDVGSGVGKFALVAGATAPQLHVTGIEQREHLVAVANVARQALRLTNVRFIHGNATDRSWAGFDGFYFFNSFAENLFEPSDRLDNCADLSMATFARDVKRSFTALTKAPVGTAVATFYGSSGRVPCTYELSHQEAAGAGWLRLWQKQDVADDGSFFVEDGDRLVQHDAAGKPY
jgi:SAM-dependent methyltransferase